MNNISSDNNQDVLKRITGGINKFELNDNKNIICLQTTSYPCRPDKAFTPHPTILHRCLMRCCASYQAYCSCNVL
ncbi:hypothetical protein AWP75_07360 [Escherichia coli]|uniref:Uncharacterized protein n=1 Tax=Escherichia coli TaxID=562 RepID=A0A1Q6BDW1_ECOLX|nr:hypothetical protein [Escherichia coli]EGO8683717.1 hypothetical protein [Escherichia coli]OKV10476.1 hypothetical protein AWP47_15350 [Escherichia coli]OKV25280.1 hypothetical protein AWP54_06410 [Escherichia coli]OKV51425.1 hypothetical protein AWP62_19675 [Escherichia coli]